MRVIQERNVPQVTYTRGLDLSGSLEGAGGIGGLLGRTAHGGAAGATYAHAFYPWTDPITVMRKLLRLYFVLNHLRAMPLIRIRSQEPR